MTTTITRKVGFLLILMTGAALLALAVFYWFLNETATEGARIAVGGWQRVLAQQMDVVSRRALAGRGPERGVLAQLVEDFDNALGVLERGGRALERELAPVDGRVREEVREVRRLWAEVKPGLLVIAGRPVDDPEAHAAFSRVEGLTARLSTAADRVVRAIDEHGRVLRRRMLYTLSAVAVFDLVVLFVGLWLTERYLTRPVRLLEEGVRRVERGELDQPVPIVTRDELATVAAAFNQMSSALARFQEESRRG